MAVDKAIEYKKRKAFRGGGMDMGNASNQAQSASMGGGNNNNDKGSDRPDPNKTGVFYNASARTYTGSIQVEVMYSDGTIEKGDILPWILKKNKKSI